jgi:uncharacterized protein (TIGR02611 family)
MRTLARGAWRTVVLVVGLTLVAVGVALLVLPGPGILVIIAGLAVLASEFVWARRLLARAREHAERVGARVRRR